MSRILEQPTYQTFATGLKKQIPANQAAVIALSGPLLIILTFLYFEWSIIPNPEFLSDIAAFEALIIALLVPIALNLALRSDEKYISVPEEEESYEFIHDDKIKVSPPVGKWEIKILINILIVNIPAAITLRFLTSADTLSLAWRIFAVAFLFVLVGVVIVVWRVLAWLMRIVDKPPWGRYANPTDLFNS